MGKRSNPVGLRLIQKKEWASTFYADSFNYSNILGQDYGIRDYVINFLARLKMHVARIDIKRVDSSVVVDVHSYNDYPTFRVPFLNRQKKSFWNKRRLYLSCLKGAEGTGLYESLPGVHSEEYGYNLKYFPLYPTIIVPKVSKIQTQWIHQTEFDYFSYDTSTYNVFSFSMRRLLCLNLSFLLRTNVIVRNIAVMTKNPILLQHFWKLAFKLRAPLPRHMILKFVCLVYHSLSHKSAMLLCRYLAVFLPRFCKKNRKQRRIRPFFYFFKRVIRLLFLYGFCTRSTIKGLKVVFKGRLNGARRKSKFIISRGRTTVHTLSDEVSYYQEHCYTIFGVSGIKVWIVY